MKNSITVLLLCIGFVLKCQNQTAIDSLLKALSSAKEDTNKAMLLGSLAWEYALEPAKAIDYAAKGIRLSEKLDYANGINSSRKSLANAYVKQGDFVKAKNIYLDLVTVHRRANNFKDLVTVYNNLAIISNVTGDFDTGINYLFLALKCSEQIGDSVRIAYIQVNIGNNYQKRNLPVKAMSFLEKARVTGEKIVKDKNWFGSLYLSIANCYSLEKNYSKAFELSKLAEQYFLETKNTYNLADLYVSMGSFAIDADDNPGAKKYIRKALALYSESKEPTGILTCLLNLSSVYYNESENLSFKGSVAQAKLDSCTMLLDTCSSMAKRMGMKDYEMFITKRQAELYAALKKFEPAFDHLSKYLIIHDSLLSLEKETRIHEINVKYETEKKETENRSLAQQNRIQQLEITRKNYFTYGLSALVLFILLTAFLVLRQNKLRAFQRTMQLEQKLLRSQMNPHFIFNSLNSIHSVVLSGDKSNAAKYLSSFAKLIRSILESSRFELITLEKEIALLENYISLQVLRFDNEIVYQIDVDPTLDRHETLLPPMLTQPFIENAIEHGLAPVSDKAKLFVSFRKEGDLLQIEVRDNGPGLGAQPKDEEHISMASAITNERLKLLNRKQRKKTSFSISEAFPQEERKGVKVSFLVPFQTN
ncbi:MAG: histidine kinase [Bacteroidia bacterium]